MPLGMRAPDATSLIGKITSMSRALHDWITGSSPTHSLGKSPPELFELLTPIATTEKTTIVIGASVGRQNSRQLKALGTPRRSFCALRSWGGHRTGAFTSRAPPPACASTGVSSDPMCGPLRRRIIDAVIDYILG
jgi:hypothetical protein